MADNRKRTHDTEDASSSRPPRVSSSAVAAARQVTPEKPKKKKSRIKLEEDRKPSAVKSSSSTAGNVEAQHSESESDDAVTGDTIMQFPKHPQTKNRDIMLNDFGFVRWARSRENPYGRLKDFVDWSHSDEGKQLELLGRGNEKFTYGQHRGCTFGDIAARDPEYHSRYMYVLGKNNQEPDPILKRYIAWFEESQTANASPNRSSNNRIIPNEVFPSGQHKGQSFRKVAREDPSYHLRYLAMREPTAVMTRYIAYFKRYGDQYAAQQANVDDLAFHAGIIPFWLGNYDDDDEYW